MVPNSWKKFANFKKFSDSFKNSNKGIKDVFKGIEGNGWFWPFKIYLRYVTTAFAESVAFLWNKRISFFHGDRGKNELAFQFSLDFLNFPHKAS